MQKVNQERLDKTIFRAKRFMDDAKATKKDNFIGLSDQKAIEVCLVVAEFKCQKCGKEEDLTIHHLIMRKAKEFMDFWRYVNQRHFWANQIVLCVECHHKYHEVLGIDIEEMGTISQAKIDKLKKRYLLEDVK